MDRTNRPFGLGIAVVAVVAAALLAPASPALAQGGNECAQATVISGLGTFGYDTRTATSSGPIINYPGGCPAMNNDVWFSWVAPQTGRVTLDTCNTTNAWGSTIGVYRACSDALPFTCDHGQAPGCSGWNAAITFGVTGGQTYLCRIDTGRPGVGSFTLTIAPLFPADECSNAITLTGTGAFPMNASGATDSEAGGYFGNDVWYRWVAPASGLTYVTTCGEPYQGVMALYEGSCDNATAYVDASDDDPGCNVHYGTAPRIDFFATAGTTYFFRYGSPWGYTTFDALNLTIAQRTNLPTQGGQVITVTTTEDHSDAPGFRTVDELPGPDGKVSFREAVTAANLTPGPQTIAFAIPQNEWYYTGPAWTTAQIINEDGIPYILTDDGTTIDGTTQAANIGDTNPAGPDVGFWSWNPNAGNSPNIIVRADHCTIRGLLGAGLMGYPVWLEGSHNTIEGCNLTPCLQGSVVIKSGDANAVRNSQLGAFGGFGARVEAPATGAVFTGNRFMGRNVGLAIAGAAGTVVGGPAPADRNLFAGIGTFGTEGFPVGTGLSITGATGTTVEGNWFGVGADGTGDANSHATAGISVSGSTGTTLRANVVANYLVRGANHYSNRLFGAGISVGAGNAGLAVEGNRVGLDAAGNPAPNLYGISVGGASQGVVIGGHDEDQANTIAFNQINGVRVFEAAKGVRITGNSIRDNVQIGIDLSPPSGQLPGAPILPGGVTPNDPGDADDGGNRLQNYPVITGVSGAGAAASVAGTLDSLPGESFLIEVYSSAGCDPSGYGEGERLAGAGPVTTDAAGHAAFSIPADLGTHGVVTATAVRVSSGDTSEFSACAPVASTLLRFACPGDFNRRNGVDLLDIFAFLQAWFETAGTADVDGSSSVELADIFVFLQAWFAGC